jgi:hypothetical protein
MVKEGEGRTGFRGRRGYGEKRKELLRGGV